MNGHKKQLTLLDQVMEPAMEDLGTPQALCFGSPLRWSDNLKSNSCYEERWKVSTS